MRAIIAGGRDHFLNESELLILDKLHKEYNFCEVISGNAQGADTEGKNFARLHGIVVKDFPADWNNIVETKDNPVVIGTNKFGKKYNKLAGHNRNRLMAQYADAIILFNGGSGTQNMREEADDLGLKVLYDQKYEVKY